MDKTSPLYINPYNLISTIPRPGKDPLPAFLQCEKHHKWGTVFELSLSDLAQNCMEFCNIVPNYINVKITKMDAENLPPTLITAEEISVVYQYDFALETT